MWLGLNETRAITLTASAAAVIAVWGVLSQRAIAARQATVEYIRETERDARFLDSQRLFRNLTNDSAGLAPWALVDKAQTPEALAIKTVLNDYEMVAIGIERGTLDDTTYRRWMRSTVVHDWRQASPYVMAVRNRLSNDALYHEFEEMARRYRDGKGMPHRRIFWAKFF